MNHVERIYELYTLADANYSGRATVPVLWDKKERTIVSNESAEIVRMLNSAFDDVGANHNDYYPEDLRAEIDELNAFIYPNVNNGVYRAGFATTQEAYEAVGAQFKRLQFKGQGARQFLLGLFGVDKISALTAAQADVAQVLLLAWKTPQYEGLLARLRAEGKVRS